MPDRSTDRPPPPLRRGALRAGALLATVLVWLPLLAPMPGCGGDRPEGPTKPSPSEVLLRLDDMEFTFGDVDEWTPFLRVAYPQVGRKTIVQSVLEQYLIPVALAERAFATERAGLLAEATAAREVLTNAYEIEQAEQRGNLAVHDRARYTRLQPAIPVAEHLFTRLNEGSVSQPIAVPRGYVLAATHEYIEVPIAGEDLVEGTQVGFFHHNVGEWNVWLRAEQARIADRVTYIHPDYRDALPTWCKRPRKQRDQ